MPVSPIGGLKAPANVQANTLSGTASAHHKHGAHALKGSFAEVATNALGTVGQAHIAVANHIHATLNTLKQGS